MAINYNDLIDTLAVSLGQSVAGASSDAAAGLQLIALGVTAQWYGSDIVDVPDTSRLAVGNFIKTVADGNWFKIILIEEDDWVQIEDIYSKGIPTGGAPVNLSATLTWDGTTTVGASSVSELQVGDSIRLNSDGQWFLVADITGSTLTIFADASQTIPSGSTQSSKAGTSFTATALPAPPEADTVEERLGLPLAGPIITYAVQYVQEQPHELPNYTVTQANAISNPATGAMIYVTNMSGGAEPAFYDGSNWRRVTDRTVMS